MADISRRLLLGSSALGLAAQAPATRPNVLFHFADQVRAAEPGYNGGKNIPTPHIDGWRARAATARWRLIPKRSISR